MKPLKNLLTILLLLLPLSAHAWGVMVTSGGVAASAPGSSYAFEENFQTATSGYDSGITPTTAGTGISPAYTTNPLRGTQSLRIVNTGDYSTVTWTLGAAMGTVYGFTRVNMGAAPLDKTIIVELLDASDNSLFSIWYKDVNRLDIKCGTAEYQYGGVNLTPSTTYFLYWRYTKGSGSNATYSCDTYTSVTKSSPVDQVSGTDGTSTADAAKVRLSSRYTDSGGVKFDQLILNASVFTADN